jgi:nucleoside-diphosphate-sugar epimerase
MVIAYQQVFDLAFTIVRPSALYGPRCVSRRVSQIFVENALQGMPLSIEGDGSERLDFTHVDDLVSGVALAVGHPQARNETFNLTYGSARSVAELVEIIRREVPGISIEHQERDRLMPIRGTLAVDKAVQRLGYAPVNPLEVGVPRYIAWYREFLPATASPARA